VCLLWNKDEEVKFFAESLNIAAPEKLFYVTDGGRYIAYWPKEYKGKKDTLQSRNAFIGSYTEKWVKEILSPVAEKINAFPVLKVKCPDIGLTSDSPADLAICRTSEKYQRSEDILLIIEVKMSVVWNWEYANYCKLS
jgi:hypothetical protein